jgi:cell division inhibitor SepF
MAFVDTIKRFVFPTVSDEDVAAEVEKEEKKKASSATQPTSSYSEETSAPGVRKARVVNINAGSVQKIVIVKLDAYAGTKLIIDHLKAKTPVVFNLARLDHGVATRVVDSVYGAAYALDGNMQKASNEIFIVTPYGMEITGDIAERIKGSDDFSWDL